MPMRRRVTPKFWLIMIALTLVCALVSALVGRRLLKKQFEKAGVTA